MKQVVCHITQKLVDENLAYRGDFIRDPIVDLINQKYPGFNHQSYISKEEYNTFRKMYVKQMFNSENAAIVDMNKEVVDSIIENKILSEGFKLDDSSDLTSGQKLADKIAEFGGSWAFIIVFFSFIILWMLTNIVLLGSHSYDPYPFILLNLILSCLAAIQAPIIMMSQNRQEQKDRKRNEQDYKINLKAELEIKLLHEKIDHIQSHQNKKLLEIQEIQTDYLEDILAQIKDNK
ncbi:MAG: DUF1003 domain-containing protein [Bacteroidetes bacterium]|nr:DUF1003 domain-containing protein [Bacteroidota bacterium]